jgi:putative transposase
VIAQANGLGGGCATPIPSPNWASPTPHATHHLIYDITIPYPHRLHQRAMPQSLANVLLHLVYSTKDRRPWLDDPQIRRELFAYKVAILRDNVDSPALLIGGVADHVHILLSLSRKFAIKDVVEEAKTETTKWLKKQKPPLKDFRWQAGYGVFSVSQSNAPKVKAYIADQEIHHARGTYQAEFRMLCRRHGVEIDERYVWD